MHKTFLGGLFGLGGHSHSCCQSDWKIPGGHAPRISGVDRWWTWLGSVSCQLDLYSAVCMLVICTREISTLLYVVMLAEAYLSPNWFAYL